MRRFSFLLFMCVAVFHFPLYGGSADSVFSHQKRYDIELGYGTPSLIFAISNSGCCESVESPVSIHAQCMYNLSRHFSLGTSLSYTAYNYEYHSDDGHGLKLGESDSYHLFTFGAVVRAYWFYKKHFAMYSKYGITFSRSSETDFDNIPFFPINISLVGFECGGSHWRAYCEPLNLLSMWPAMHAGVKYLF